MKAAITHISDWLTFVATYRVGRCPARQMMFFAPNATAAQNHMTNVAAEYKLENDKTMAILSLEQVR